MRDTFAVLLDGGFIRARLGSYDAPLTTEQVHRLIEKIQAHPFLSGKSLYRSYFYDARPMEGTMIWPNGGESEIGDSPAAKAIKSLHSGLEAMPFMTLRFGEVYLINWQYGIDKYSVASKKVAFPLTVQARDVKPNFGQKGVDMRIGLDIAALTLKKQVSTIVLVAGDSDLIPAVQFAQEEGAQVMLFALGQPIGPVLHNLVTQPDIFVGDDFDSLPAS